MTRPSFTRSFAKPSMNGFNFTKRKDGRSRRPLRFRLLKHWCNMPACGSDQLLISACHAALLANSFGVAFGEGGTSDFRSLCQLRFRSQPQITRIAQMNWGTDWLRISDHLTSRSRQLFKSRRRCDEGGSALCRVFFTRFQLLSVLDESGKQEARKKSREGFASPQRVRPLADVANVLITVNN